MSVGSESAVVYFVWVRSFRKYIRTTLNLEQPYFTQYSSTTYNIVAQLTQPRFQDYDMRGIA